MKQQLSVERQTTEVNVNGTAAAMTDQPSKPRADPRKERTGTATHGDVTEKCQSQK
jgi:hypothetical protein